MSNSSLNAHSQTISMKYINEIFILFVSTLFSCSIMSISSSFMFWIGKELPRRYRCARGSNSTALGTLSDGLHSCSPSPTILCLLIFTAGSFLSFPWGRGTSFSGARRPSMLSRCLGCVHVGFNGPWSSWRRQFLAGSNWLVFNLQIFMPLSSWGCRWRGALRWLNPIGNPLFNNQ